MAPGKSASQRLLQRSTPPQSHAVRFYGDDNELSTAVAEFLVEGFGHGQPAVMIATPTHEQGILEQLLLRDIDVMSARKIGDLVVLNAEQTLSTFMVAGTPDPALFRRHVGGVFEQATRGRERTPVRAYGEMVDVLWKQGRTDAAIRLEVLWNELATQHSFSLLCSYAIGNFLKQTSKLERVIAEHSHVHGAVEIAAAADRKD